MTRERTRLSRVLQLCVTGFAIGVFGLAALHASSGLLADVMGTSSPPPIDITISAPTTFAVADGLDGSTDGTLNADNLTIDSGGSITCNDPSLPTAADACPITIVVGGRMLMKAGSAITADNTVDGGNAGDITITVGTDLTMCGPNGGQPGCASNAGGSGALISSQKQSGGATTAPSTVTITVGNKATATGNFYMEGGSTGYGTETGAKIITDSNTGKSGTIAITTGKTYFTEPGSVLQSGFQGSTNTFIGGKIYLVSDCGFTTEGRITSKGPDPGADLVHLESCEVIIRGLVESTGVGHGTSAKNNCDNIADGLPGEVLRDHPAASTGCIEVWGNIVTIDSSSGWAGELNADIGNQGGSEGTSWIDIFASSKLTVIDDTGNDFVRANGANDYLSTYAVHANSLIGSDHNPSVVTAKVKNGPLTATGKAFEASSTITGGQGTSGGLDPFDSDTGHGAGPYVIGNGSYGGTIDLEALGAVTLDSAWLNASGDFAGGRPCPPSGVSGACGSGGHIIVSAWGTGSALSWTNGSGDVRPNDSCADLGLTSDCDQSVVGGTIALNAGGTITITSTDFHGEVPTQTHTSDASKPDIPVITAGNGGPVFKSDLWLLCSLSTVSGKKYDFDTGEGLDNWEIHLFNADGSVHMVETTAGGGFYTFTNVPTGTYTVCEKLKSGWTEAFPALGANCATPGDPDNETPGAIGYTIDTTAFCCSGQQITGKDFGNDPPVPPGSLKIIKTVTGAPDGFTGSFDVHVVCSVGGPYDETITYPSPGFVTIPNIPAGTSCTVTEQPLPAPPTGYSWDTVVITTSPTSIVSGTTVDVTVANSLTRDKGSLKIIKTVTGAPDGFTGSFDVHVVCTAGGGTYDRTISYPAPGFVTITDLPTGSTCTVTEPTPPGAPAGYSWGTVTILPTPSAAITKDGTAEVTVTNPLTRDKGSLKITKTVTGGPDGFSGSFDVHVVCTAGGGTYDRTISYPSPGFVTITDLPTGSTCTVTEPTPPGAPGGYSWGTVTILPTPSAAITKDGTAEVTVTNPLTRDKGSLKITKTVTGGPGGFSGSFDVHVVCTAGGGTYDRTISYPAPGFVTITDLPTGSTCTVTEPTQPGAPAGYSWGTVTILPTPSAAITKDGTAEVTVTNPLNPVTPATGSLKVTKYVTGIPPGGFFMASFTVHVECTAGGPFADKVFTYPFPGYVTYTGIPAGATCTVTEITKSAPPGGYTWGPEVISPTPSAPIPAGGTAYVTITNPLCPAALPPGLGLTKTADKTTVTFGESVTYTYVVKNTGGVTLTDVVVVDDNGTPSFAGDDVTVGTIASLEPGTSQTFTRTLVPPAPVCGKDYGGHTGTCGQLLTEHRSDGTTKFTYLQAKDGRDGYSGSGGWSGKRSYAQQTQFRVWNKNGTYTDVNTTLGAGDGSKYFNSFSFVVNKSSIADASGKVKLPGIFHKSGWSRDWHLDWDKLYGDPTRKKYWDTVAPSWDKYTDRHTCSADVTNTAKVTAKAGAQTLTASDTETVTVK